MSAPAATEVVTNISSAEDAKDFLAAVIEDERKPLALKNLVTRYRFRSSVTIDASITDVTQDGAADEIFGYAVFFAATKLEGEPAFIDHAIEQYRLAVERFTSRIRCLTKSDNLEIKQLNHYIDIAKRRIYLLEKQKQATGFGVFIGFFQGLLVGLWRGLIWAVIVTAVLSAVAAAIFGISYAFGKSSPWNDIYSFLPSIIPFDFSNVISLSPNVLLNPLTWGVFIASVLIVYTAFRFAYYGAKYGYDGAWEQAKYELWSLSTLVPHRAWRSDENDTIAREIKAISGRNPPSPSASSRIGYDSNESSAPSSAALSSTEVNNNIGNLEESKSEAPSSSSQNASGSSATTIDSRAPKPVSSTFAGVDFTHYSNTGTRRGLLASRDDGDASL